MAFGFLFPLKPNMGNHEMARVSLLVSLLTYLDVRFVKFASGSPAGWFHPLIAGLTPGGSIVGENQTVTKNSPTWRIYFTFFFPGLGAHISGLAPNGYLTRRSKGPQHHPETFAGNRPNRTWAPPWRSCEGRTRRGPRGWSRGATPSPCLASFLGLRRSVAFGFEPCSM